MRARSSFTFIINSTKFKVLRRDTDEVHVYHVTWQDSTHVGGYHLPEAINKLSRYAVVAYLQAANAFKLHHD